MEQELKQKKIILDLIKKFTSMREFARQIQEDPADVIKWRDGKTKIKPRAVITLIRMFGIDPFDLRPDIFGEDVIITFKK